MGSGARLIQTHVCGCLETAILTKRGAHLQREQRRCLGAAAGDTDWVDAPSLPRGLTVC